MSNTLQPAHRTPRFVGYFDSFEAGAAKGWACDLAAQRESVRLHVLIDGQEVATVLCNEPRPDVQAAMGSMTAALGFTYQIPEQFIDGLQHEVGFRFGDRSVVPVFDSRNPQGNPQDRTFRLTTRYEFQSYVDGFKQGALRGWVHRIDPATGERTGACSVRVLMDGAELATTRADRYRGDVAAATGGDPNCGFEVIIPRTRQRSGMLTFRFIVVPDDIELGGSPVVTSIVEDQMVGRLLGISETIERLHRELTALRTQMRDLMPIPGYNLGDYDRWASAYRKDLRERVAARRVAIGHTVKDEPLVSIICPTYRPEMSDFNAAVGSVLAQTWQNWELIIVDDGGKSKEVAARIVELCKQDKRIRSVKLKTNVGISGATNAGIAAAKGEWVAFFDHDDMMTDVAIEAMFQAARESTLNGNAPRVLYSDEDKVDQAGYFLEPNFKPDFDYRFLLGCNYICHLLIVRTEVLREAGELRSQYDGAQDHDLILRLTEIVPHREILHVPEVLYHWRKTPNSTAVTIANKGYAINSGVTCVSDHLKRLGHAAEVSAIRGLTLYSVKWKLTAKPKVSIIIPFRDAVETTAECVERILKHTKYPKYEIVLVDNWSVKPDTVEFCKKITKHRNVRVLRVEEPFNFSRLNNLATADNDADFFFFMNNDLFVEDPAWLSTIVAEALSSDDIGAVGGKFFYPNGTIQHVGVVVGPAGVAAHPHRGLQDGEYGYIGRAVLSYEVSAVTAAGMLVRADAFRAVGAFDELNLAVAYNDVDLCLRLREAGWRIIQCNEFTAVHHESLSRGSDDRPEHEARFFAETQYMQTRWGDQPIYQHDPAYSPHFTVDLQPYYDLVTPGEVQPGS